MNQTTADLFQNDPTTSDLVRKTVQHAETYIRKIERQIRPPNPALAEAAQQLYKATGQVRGRPLFYQYLGSGLGNGPYVELVDGSVKMDLINGIGIHIMGHSHPLVIEACLKGSLSDIVMQGNLEPNREYYWFSQKLLQVAAPGSRLKHAWLSTCGTMANENALKACRQKTNKARMVIAMDAAFAGRSTMMAEITDNPSFKEGLPEYNEVVRVPFFDKKNPRSTEDSLRIFKQHLEKHDGQICCFTFEPMQGEGGYNVAPREFFVPMLDLCQQKKIPVWFDEVQTFMRTGQFFAYQTLDLGDYVDVCTIAKTAQNGATLFTEELNPKPGLIAGTFSGASPALAAGTAILQHLDQGGYMGPAGRIQGIHKEFVGMLNDLNRTTCKGLLQEAGGLGLMIAVTPLDGSKEKVSALMQLLFKNGLICFNCGRGPYRLRFLLPIVMTSADIATAKAVIEKSILELA
jgi:4-aminobutyrate aminotransferase-like enzyme